jgi:hypothetical protein
MCHGDTGAVVETHYVLHDVNQDDVRRIAVLHRQLYYQRHRRLRACPVNRRACVCFLCGVTLEYNRQRAFVVITNKKRVTTTYGDTCA